MLNWTWAVIQAEKSYKNKVNQASFIIDHIEIIETEVLCINIFESPDLLLFPPSLIKA